MTLILAFSHPQFAVLASDRLVTLADGASGRYVRDHNALANKSLVLVAKDAVVAVGFCGSAYIGSRFTDDWIAETITAVEGVLGPDGRPGMFGLRKPSELKLHQICNRLRRGLAESPEARAVHVIIVGWRRRRNGPATPITLAFGAVAVLGRHPEMTMRPSWPVRPTCRSIGAVLIPAEFNAALNAHTARGGVLNEDGTVALLTGLIRRKAGTDPTVGPHVMSVTLYHPLISRRAVCCFEPLAGHYGEMEVDGVQARSPVAYSPWILTPQTFSVLGSKHTRPFRNNPAMLALPQYGRLRGCRLGETARRAGGRG